MPVDFLTATQRQRYGRYPDSLSADELARNFHLDDDDRECIANKRRDSGRLGFALQLVTVRFLGTFLEDPAAVPFTVLHFVAAQIEVADLTCVAAYRQSEQRWRHTTEIRARYGYSEFVDRGVQFRLGRWLCALCWTGTDRPSLLFDHASGWLIGHKVLLPGISILERFVAEVRSRMEARLWRLLVRDVGADQQRRLDELLAPVDEGSRQSWFDRLRKGPVRVSGPALVQALLRVETVRGLGIKLPATPVPPSRIASLARFANTVKVSAVARLPVARRTATLVAFIHSLEASAQDDALDVLAVLLRDLFTQAEQADRKARLRSLKDLDRAASTLAEACRLLLDPSLPDGELRERVYAVIGHEELAKALTDVSNLVRPSEDVFYQELAEKRATVRRFLPILLRVIRFDSNAAARPLLEALQWLHERPDHDPPIVIVDKPWHRHVLREDGRIDLPEILIEIAARTGCMDAFTHLTERTARANDLTTSLCGVLLAEACNTGPEPFVRQDTPALRRDRLLWVDQNYVRDETLTAANTLLVAAQSRIPLARTWGGGDVASADGMRFVVPVRTIHAGPNPKYFNRGRGVTWYNLVSDQATGLNAITVPGTLRDSLVLLSVVLEQQTELQPTHIMTDTGAYSDVVFGLFRLLGYRFCPRLADIGGTRFWRIDSKADYGELNSLARQRISLDRIAPYWDDVMRLVGSLKLGRVSAMSIMRTLQVDDSPTHLAQAVAEIGRIDKTIHTLNFIDDETRRRSTLQQLNLGEGRHSLARDVFHGKRGELYQRYREGQEDQLSALGLVVNMIVLWNTIYMDAVLDQLRAEGFSVLPEDEARLSPFGHEHINMLGRYSFAVPEAVARGELRPLRTEVDA